MIKLGYTNWRGEHTVRDITPFHLWFGTTQWHPEPQWFIRAFDHDKQAERDFALSGFGSVPQEAPAEPVAANDPEWVPDIPGSAWPAEDEGCDI